MTATVKYEGSTSYVTYTANSYLLRGADDIVIQAGHKGTIFAYAGNDTVHGSTGADLVYGGDGNDLLLGNNGADTLYGQNGDDSIDGGGDNSADKLYGDAGNDTLSGGGGADTIYGGADNDRIYGNAGNDDLYGGAGNDTIYADSGWDYLMGEDGNDFYVIEAIGKSEIWETSGDEDVIIFTAVNYDDLSYAQQGDDLWIASAATIASGSFSSGVIIHDYYAAGSDTIEYLAGADGTAHLLTDFLLLA